MKKKILEEIIIKKTKKNEFAIITNLNNGIRKAIKWQREYYGW